MGIRKKIVIVGPAYPYRGGNSLYVSHLYDILKPNFDVKVINYKLLYPAILFPGTTQKDISNFIVKTVPSDRIINSVNPFTWFKAAKAIRAEKADLVIFDWWNPFFGPSHYIVSKLIRKHYKRKLIFITENVISHEGRFVDRFLTRIGLRNADSFIALSRIVENTVKEFFPERKIYRSALPVYDCYNIEPEKSSADIIKERKTLGFSEDNLVLLFFGYVRKYKGLDTLIEAMPAIVEKNPAARLLIVGEFYDSPEKYYKLIETLGMKDYVNVVQRFVPNEEVGKYYLLSDLVILPYREATQSGVLNISYGFSKPVVVTDVGGLSEDVVEGKTGFVIKPDNPSAISDVVAHFTQNRDKINFAKNIEDKLARHPFKHFPELIEQIISETL